MNASTTTFVQNQEWYNHKPLHADGSSKISPLLHDWLQHVEQGQVQRKSCGFKVNDNNVKRVLEYIKDTCTDNAVIMAHYSMFHEDNHDNFERILDRRFGMFSSDMIMHGRVLGIPVVTVCDTHSRYAYEHDDRDWIAVWYPPVEFQFWQGTNFKWKSL